MGIFGEKKRWTGVDFSTLVAVPDVSCQVDPDSGKIVLLQPRYRDWFFGRILQPRLSGKKRYVRVPLESRGTFLWGLLDGQRTVGDLVLAFIEEFPAESQNAAERVAGFLYNMERNGFIRFSNLETT